MFGDSFFTCCARSISRFWTLLFSSPCLGILFSPQWWLSLSMVERTCFRPHVWGFFFHISSIPMVTFVLERFRPHVWGFFFHERSISLKKAFPATGFRPHVWGFFFHIPKNMSIALSLCSFSSPCLGILFSRVLYVFLCSLYISFVFVPMFGDSFFTFSFRRSLLSPPACFRPHVWGFFFHHHGITGKEIASAKVFVPMFGDSFFTGGKDFPIDGGTVVFVPMFGDSFFT